MWYSFPRSNFCDFDLRIGKLSTGYYLNNLELEGNQKEFYVKQFYAYEVYK
jgi:hypothetical protein